MPRTRPPYPPEFRREAIKLVRISSKSQHQIAEDLGISDVTLRNWVKQAERDEGKRPDSFCGRLIWLPGSSSSDSPGARGSLQPCRRKTRGRVAARLTDDRRVPSRKPRSRA